MSGHHHHHHVKHHDHHDHHERVGSGPAVLDIGGDVGALVATVNHGRAGTELYLRPVQDPATTVHTGVWERVDAGPVVTVALFPELREGSYHLLDERGAAVRRVEIVGGEVATIDLRT